MSILCQTMSTAALAADTDQSDREYILRRQQRQRERRQESQPVTVTDRPEEDK